MKIFVRVGNTRLGPLDQEVAQSMLTSGAVKVGSLAWREGDVDWRPIEQVLGLAVEPPPLPGMIADGVELAERASRLFAVAIDVGAVLVGCLASVIAYYVASSIVYAWQAPVAKALLPDEPKDAGWRMASLVLIAFFVWYFWRQIGGLARKGQTIGKSAMKIKLVRVSTYKVPSLARSLGLRIGVFVLLLLIPIVGEVLLVADALFIFGESRRCLHDLLAETIVIKA